jgi:CcmD family protein
MDTFYKFLEQNSMYVVLIILLVIWIGIYFYIHNIDKRLRKLEQEEK